ARALHADDGEARAVDRDALPEYEFARDRRQFDLEPLAERAPAGPAPTRDPARSFDDPAEHAPSLPDSGVPRASPGPNLEPAARHPTLLALSSRVRHAMRVHVITIFPRLIEGFVTAGIPRIAVEKGALAVEAVDLRQFTQDVHRTVDDRPFGGGPGMVMLCAPIFAA